MCGKSMRNFIKLFIGIIPAFCANIAHAMQAPSSPSVIKVSVNPILDFLSHIPHEFITAGIAGGAAAVVTLGIMGMSALIHKHKDHKAHAAGKKHAHKEHTQEFQKEIKQPGPEQTKESTLQKASEAAAEIQAKKPDPATDPHILTGQAAISSAQQNAMPLLVSELQPAERQTQEKNTLTR